MKIIKIAGCFVFLLLIFTQCPIIEPAVENTLTGYWKSGTSYADGFEITTFNKFYQYDNADKSISFAGDIVDNSLLSNESGFITIKITDSGTWMKTVNEYLVVRWKNMAGNYCKECTPYKSGGASTMPTILKAEEEFTIENEYYNPPSPGWGEYIKQ
jgi:hypothetical protein